MEDHDRVAAMEPAAWIVDHKDNAYPVPDAEDTSSQPLLDALRVVPAGIDISAGL